MKKTVIFAIVLGLMFYLAACATTRKTIEISQSTSTIVSIDIYNIDQQYYEGDVSSLRAENTPVYTIDSEEKETFIEMLGFLEFEKEEVLFPIPMDGGYDYCGYVISIVYEDGGYDIISEEGLFFYSVDDGGKEKYKYDYADYCGETPWSTLIEAYIEK